MRKLFFVLILCMFLVPLAVSAEPSYNFQRNSEVDLKTYCFNETDGRCDSSINCNITIQYPNGSLLLNDKTMTFNSNYYNITLNSNQTDILGEYFCNVACYGTDNGFSTFSYEVTRNGLSNLSTTSVSIFVFAGIFIITIILLVLMHYLEQGLKLPLLLMVILVMTFSLNLIANLLENAAIGDNVIRLAWWLYRGAATGFWVTFLYVLWKLTMELKIRKNPPPDMGSPLQQVKAERKSRKRRKYNGY